MGAGIGPSGRQYGLGQEATVGTAVASATGLAVLNDTRIRSGHSPNINKKATGKPYMTAAEMKVGVHNPMYDPQITMWPPYIGYLQALCTQKATESGAGPYVQTITFPSEARKISIGDTVTAGSTLSATVWELLGQSTSRDVTLAGAVVKEIEFNFPATGEATMTPTFIGLAYDNTADGTAGSPVFTLPGTAEKLSSDFKCNIGSAALYSEEWSFKIAGNWTWKHYGGQSGGIDPASLVCDRWDLTGNFQQIVTAAGDTISKDYFYGGGDGATSLMNSVTITIWSRTLSSYVESSATWSDGEMRWQLTGSVTDEPTIGGEGEMVESFSFTGADSSNPLNFESCSTAAQGWAA